MGDKYLEYDQFDIYDLPGLRDECIPDDPERDHGCDHGDRRVLQRCNSDHNASVSVYMAELQGYCDRSMGRDKFENTDCTDGSEQRHHDSMERCQPVLHDDMEYDQEHSFDGMGCDQHEDTDRSEYDQECRDECVECGQDDDHECGECCEDDSDECIQFRKDHSDEYIQQHKIDGFVCMECDQECDFDTD